MGAKRSLKSNAVALAEVCKANDERAFARMRGNDVDAPIPAIPVTSIGRLNSTLSSHSKCALRTGWTRPSKRVGKLVPVMFLMR